MLYSYKFEQYSVALPYNKCDVMLNGSCGQRNHSLAWSHPALLSQKARNLIIRYLHGMYGNTVSVNLFSEIFEQYIYHANADMAPAIEAQTTREIPQLIRVQITWHQMMNVGRNSRKYLISLSFDRSLTRWPITLKRRLCQSGQEVSKNTQIGLRFDLSHIVSQSLCSYCSLKSKRRLPYFHELQPW